MTFFDAIEICLFRKYCTWRGRASRSEYWYFFLFYVLLQITCTIITKEKNSTLSYIISFIFFLPNLSVLIRRLHDLNKSALWAFTFLFLIIFYVIFIDLIPSTFIITICNYALLLGVFLFLLFLTQKGTPFGEYNKYQENLI